METSIRVKFVPISAEELGYPEYVRNFYPDVVRKANERFLEELGTHCRSSWPGAKIEAETSNRTSVLFNPADADCESALLLWVGAAIRENILKFAWSG